MNKTIIVIKGAANTGKSETLRALIYFLAEIYPDEPVLQSPTSERDAMRVVFEIDGTKVGIETEANIYVHLVDSLAEFAEAGCDIIVCPARATGFTISAINQFQRTHGYEIIWTTNNRPANGRSHLNKISAAQYLLLIRALISGKTELF